MLNHLITVNYFDANNRWHNFFCFCFFLAIEEASVFLHLCVVHFSCSLHSDSPIHQTFHQRQSNIAVQHVLGRREMIDDVCLPGQTRIQTAGRSRNSTSGVNQMRRPALVSELRLRSFCRESRRWVRNNDEQSPKNDDVDDDDVARSARQRWGRSLLPLCCEHVDTMENTRDGNAKQSASRETPLQEARKHKAGGSVGGGRFYGRIKGGPKKKKKKVLCVSTSSSCGSRKTQKKKKAKGSWWHASCQRTFSAEHDVQNKQLRWRFCL